MTNENKTLKHRFNNAVNGQSVTIEIVISYNANGEVGYILYMNGCQETNKTMGIPNIEGFDENGQPIKNEARTS